MDGVGSIHLLLEFRIISTGVKFSWIGQRHPKLLAWLRDAQAIWSHYCYVRLKNEDEASQSLMRPIHPAIKYMWFWFFFKIICFLFWFLLRIYRLKMWAECRWQKNLGRSWNNSSGQCKLSHFLFEKETHNHLRLQDKSLPQVKRPGEKEIQESLDFTYTLANLGHKWSEISFNHFSDTCI